VRVHAGGPATRTHLDEDGPRADDQCLSPSKWITHRWVTLFRRSLPGLARRVSKLATAFPVSAGGRRKLGQRWKQNQAKQEGFGPSHQVKRIKHHATRNGSLATCGSYGDRKVGRRQLREKELTRLGVTRSHSESSQVTRVGFGPERMAVTQRVSGCYCESARCRGLWRFRESGVRLTKNAERRTKRASASGSHRVWQDAGKSFRNAGDVTNNTAGL
jgi:hypothetical protein